MKKLTSLIIVACLFLTVLPVLSGCGNGISTQQRESYLQMAKDYEAKATVEETLATTFRNAANKLPYSSGYDDKRRSFETQAKQCDDNAENYRQLALKYRDLAAK